MSLTTFVIYVFVVCTGGFVGAFTVLLAIGMYVEPYNATQENMTVALGGAALTICAAFASDWIEKHGRKT